ncbi:MAG: O-methyltransferase [Firmicutes bacterium]|uniref:Predicted O-methyltransferase YrrM n=1 Tax=Melghirimyces thermohalophilus TaxID=1236220 RepID=A0A1G6HKP9_9BACL|nr:O-methyltransferase [Melghirimyces thermohalophilus]MDA8354381.1 O-methyltransferase [Bacillota bacterium]SDB94830.1 Predicted O-methyltransferase YrrM [Melghirimyces thermohalophilus]
MKREAYVRERFAQEDPVLQSIRDEHGQRGLPPIAVPPETGKILKMLVQISGARQVLEIGGLAGISAIWMARGLPSGGDLLSLEANPKHIAIAEENLRKAGLSDRVRYRLGEAGPIMDTLFEEGHRFDFFFIDADKENYPRYLEQAIRLSRPGAVITLDNLFFHDRIFDSDRQEASVEAIRETNRLLAKDDRLDSTILPVGDGLGVARLRF